MFSKIKAVFVVLMGFFVLGWIDGSAWAKEYQIDAAHSSINFRIRHLVSKTRGRFEKFEGKIDYDPKKPTAAKIEAKIEVDSIDTDHKKRDDHLKSEDFFNEDKFPEIRFVSTKVTGSGKNLKLNGELTMHGVTKPVTLNVEVSGPAEDGGKERMGFHATTTLKRKDFGIVWNKTLDQGGVMLGEDVEIDIDVEAVAQPAAKP